MNARRSIRRLAVALPALFLATGCLTRSDRSEWPPDVERRLLLASPLPPLPPSRSNRFAEDAAAAKLGQRLFFDSGLSGSGRLACASCHDPSIDWSDGRRFSSAGVGPRRRHTPSLWNVGYGRWFGWDGRADSLWAKAIGSLESATEMGGDRTAAAHRVRSDRELRAGYENVFGAMPDLSDPKRFPIRARPSSAADEIRTAWQAMSEDDRAAIDGIAANLGKSIEAYARQIVSRDAPFDRFAEGLRSGDPVKLATLSAPARRGAALFYGRLGCYSCHPGPTFSDGEFHDLGLSYGEDGRAGDPGRAQGIGLARSDPFNAIGRFSDAPDAPAAIRFLAASDDAFGAMKTPSLRNVARTAPYGHDGRFATLNEVLHFDSTLSGAKFAHHHRERLLRPLALTNTEVGELIAFLDSLTGAPLDPSWLRRPETSAEPAP